MTTEEPQRLTRVPTTPHASSDRRAVQQNNDNDSEKEDLSLFSSPEISHVEEETPAATEKVEEVTDAAEQLKTPGGVCAFSEPEARRGGATRPDAWLSPSSRVVFTGAASSKTKLFSLRRDEKGTDPSNDLLTPDTATMGDGEDLLAFLPREFWPPHSVDDGEEEEPLTPQLLRNTIADFLAATTTPAVASHNQTQQRTYGRTTTSELRKPVVRSGTTVTTATTNTTGTGGPTNVDVDDDDTTVQTADEERFLSPVQHGTQKKKKHEEDPTTAVLHHHHHHSRVTVVEDQKKDVQYRGDDDVAFRSFVPLSFAHTKTPKVAVGSDALRDDDKTHEEPPHSRDDVSVLHHQRPLLTVR